MRKSPPGHEETGWKRRFNALKDFWTKVNNDWVFNLSGLLAYNLLMSIFPILLVLIAVVGFILGFISPNAMTNLKDGIKGVLPSGIGATVVDVVLGNLHRSAGLVFVIGLLTAAFAGSRLFITIANCFNIVFRLRPRDALHQNIMAFSMLLLYIVLVPVVFLSSSVANVIAQAVVSRIGGLGAWLIQLSGIGAALLAAIILFAAIYIVVPNRPVHWKEVWRGTLTGAALLVLYELVFPLYQRYLLKPDNYGATAGFAIVILVFFYYFAFILLLGAEVNSWFAGQRATASGIAGIVHEVQAHDTTRGAAGPTAGMPQEDLQSEKGKAAMTTNAKAIEHERLDHKDDEKPPKFSEATSPHPHKTAEAAEHTTGYNQNRPQHRPEPGRRSDTGAPGPANESRRASDSGRQTGDSREIPSRQAHHEASQPQQGSRVAASTSMAASMDASMAASMSGPSRPEYANPLPPEARDLPKRRHGSSLLPAIGAIGAAAIPVVMWLLGRNNQRHT